MRIGVFDSGIGGLTVLRELKARLGGHDLLYLGDTARIPYGTRSPQTVISYSLRVASYLVEQGIDALVIACNTATTHALPDLEAACEPLGIPVFGVVHPGVQAALQVHEEGQLALLGTEGTVLGGAYHRALAEAAPDQELIAVPCPLFVPLVEEGWLEGVVPTEVARRYLEPLQGRVDTAILGCTHYPLLREVIASVLPGVHLVDSARATAEAVLEALGPGEGTGSLRFMVTDGPERFADVGERFLGERPDPVEWVDVGQPTAAFSRPLPA